MRKLNKKGFTLVELLAVIAILALLMLLVTPNILMLFTEGKKNAFATQVQSVWKAAETKYINDSLTSSTPGPYCYVGTGLDGSFAEIKATNPKDLGIDNNKTLAYFVKFDSEGKIAQLIVTNGSYYYSSDTPSIDVDVDSDVKTVKSTDKFACDATTGVGTYTVGQ